MTTKVSAFLLLGVTFVAGVLVGVSFEYVRGAAGPPQPPPFMGRPGPAGLPRPFERLDLTEEQRERIRTILESSRHVTDSILQQTMPRLRQVTDSIRDEVHAVLTPEQAAQLEEEFSNIRRRSGRGRFQGMPFRKGPRRLRPPRDTVP